MDNTDIKVSYLAADNEFYNNVFKRTERIVSVTLYVVSETEKTKDTEILHDVVKVKALAALEAALAALALQAATQRRGLFALQHALVGLGSALQLATVGQLIAAETATLINAELDAVQRYLKHHYLQVSTISLQSLPDSTSPSISSHPRSVTHRPPARPGGGRPSTAPRAGSRSLIPPGDISTDAYLVYSQLTDRAERIKTVLSAKPAATIKDIAEVITDVSEKTIQRELNSLIEKGQVIRDGERRWSKYSMKN